MQSSTHKKIVIAGLGCGAVVVALGVVGFVLALRLGPEPPPARLPVNRWQSAAALDSLRRVDWVAVLAHPPRDTLLLRPHGRGNGALVAWTLWRDTLVSPVAFAFGDTAPQDSPARHAWLATARSPVVDRVLVAATLPWDPAAVPPVDSGNAYRGGIDAGRVLFTTRATLAAARRARDTHAPARADSLVRAVVSLGRRLEDDSMLARTALGLRLEFEALSMLELRDSAAARARVATALRATERVLALFRAAGADGAHSDTLAAWARDRGLALPLRFECVIAVGYGWLGTPNEMLYGLDARRRRGLESLDGSPLPPTLRAAVAAGERAVRLPVAARIALVGVQ
ncbi:MAG TPA: hypothetical protein VH116_08310 [Gemmatimonadales bacterium]|jgi:hypothetical protein|nr:hypothetical protein [Gemmatimonadales bacterium]